MHPELHRFCLPDELDEVAGIADKEREDIDLVHGERAEGPGNLRIECMSLVRAERTEILLFYRTEEFLRGRVLSPAGLDLKCTDPAAEV